MRLSHRHVRTSDRLPSTVVGLGVALALLIVACSSDGGSEAIDGPRPSTDATNAAEATTETADATTDPTATYDATESTTETTTETISDVTPSSATAAATDASSPNTGERLDIGEFTGIDIWVDPVHGDDANDGTSRVAALRTVDAAWQQVPAGEVLTTGRRIMLAPGTYPVEGSVNYWEDRHGTAGSPIIVQSADGPHTAIFESDMNVFGVSYLYVLGVDIIRQGDAFHCEQCDHVLIRDAELSGGGADGTGAHETVKVNQSQYVYIEDSDIHGAEDNAIDFVAVQYGHVIGNRIHSAADWCMYTKGGSAYIDVIGNEVFDCGTGGITAGQGTGFEFMRSPWLQYEAYGIRIVDNIVHHVEGAGLGVNGGFNVLLAHNTLYSVGSRSHVIEIAHGRRGCDGDAATCQSHHDEGGWGSTGEEDGFIPSRHVYVYDNIVVNPTGSGSQWQHFQVDGPLEPPATSGVPAPSTADDDLRIVGNVIWNGPPDHPTGAGDGCADPNPTCNEAQIHADNAINTIEPELVDPDHGDFHLTEATQAAMPPPAPLPDFDWTDLPGVPPGETSNQEFSTSW